MQLARNMRVGKPGRIFTERLARTRNPCYKYSMAVQYRFRTDDTEEPADAACAAAAAETYQLAAARSARRGRLWDPGGDNRAEELGRPSDGSPAGGDHRRGQPVSPYSPAGLTGGTVSFACKLAQASMAHGLLGWALNHR